MKNIFLAGLLGSQYLFEISEIVNNSENAVKRGCFERRFQFFFQMKERYKY